MIIWNFAGGTVRSFFIICLFLFLRLKETREKSIEDQYILVEFTDEEGFGRYLDLHEAYMQFMNL